MAVAWKTKFKQWIVLIILNAGQSDDDNEKFREIYGNLVFFFIYLFVLFSYHQIITAGKSEKVFFLSFFFLYFFIYATVPLCIMHSWAFVTQSHRPRCFLSTHRLRFRSFIYSYVDKCYVHRFIMMHYYEFFFAAAMSKETTPQRDNVMQFQPLDIGGCSCFPERSFRSLYCSHTRFFFYRGNLVEEKMRKKMIRYYSNTLLRQSKGCLLINLGSLQSKLTKVITLYALLL